MEKLFIETRSDTDIEPVLKKLKLKGKIGIVTTVQHLHKVKKLKGYIIGGSVLGCNVSNAIRIKDDVDHLVYVGSGEFHPLEIALQTGKKVIVVNPLSKRISKTGKEEIEKRKKRIKGLYLKFLRAEKIGILVSTKPGQYNLKKALELKKKLKEKSYIFLFNTLREEELENFPDIDIFVNTACPRIEYKNVINIQDLKL